MYDDYGEEGIKGGTSAEEYDSFDPFDVFGHFFNSSFGSFMDPFEDSFSMNGNHHHHSRNQKPEDRVQELSCTLEDLYNGVTRKVSIPRDRVCKTCKGKGCQPGGSVKCKRCRGSGMERNGFGFFTCSLCNGTKEFIPQKNRCKLCCGRGVIHETKQWDVAIPRGSEEGDTIRVKNAGDEEVGTKPGDVVFVIHEESHPLFKRDHSHLYAKITITLAEALCGFSHTIMTLDQRKLHFSSPKGTVINVIDS